MDIFLNQAQSLEEKGRLDEAIEFYRLYLERNPNQASWCNCKIGRVKANQGKFKQAIFSYQKGIEIKSEQPVWVYMSLGDALEQNGQMEEAISAYQQAIKMKPNRGIIYARLANAMIAQENIPEAITAYQKAIEIKSEQPVWVYANLGDALKRNGQLKEAISAYQQALKFQPETFYIHRKLVALLKIQGREDEAAKWLEQYPQVRQGKIYSKIWHALNQKNTQLLEKESFDYPTKLNQQIIERYFQLTSQYRNINLVSLGEQDLNFLNSHNISLANLNLILKNSHSYVQGQDVYLKYFDSKYKRSSEKTIEIARYPLYPWLNSILETSHIYAMCPISGRVLKSNQSFILVTGYVGILYRFVGDEVFYLLAGWIPGGKLKLSAIYFPRLDLVVELVNNPHLNLVPSFDFLKAWLVSNWETVKDSISLKSENPKKLLNAVSFHFNIGHNLVNDISGIEVLLKAGLLSKIDKFCVGEHEYFGYLEDIYPEIPQDKIIRWENGANSHQEVSKIALQNNYFSLAVRGHWVSEDLAKRIHRVSLKKCSQSFLSKVDNASKCFPLIWISFRVHNRSWISQVEGIANIINRLSVDFPNLGIVFDGFSFADCHLAKDDKLMIRKKDIVNQENAIVEKILALIQKKNIAIHNTIGCMVHESIIWAYAADFYIASMGAGLSKVSLLANKPGVQHSCSAYVKVFKEWYNAANRENATIPITIPNNFIIDEDSSHWSSSYDCDWKVIYNEAMETAQKLSKK